LLAVSLVAQGCGGGNGGGSGSGDTTTATVAPPANTPSTVKRFAVGGRPDAISAGAGYVWVTDSFAGTLKRMSPRGGRATDVPVAGFPRT
jgi:hypothetical protein